MHQTGAIDYPRQMLVDYRVWLGKTGCSAGKGLTSMLFEQEGATSRPLLADAYGEASVADVMRSFLALPQVSRKALIAASVLDRGTRTGRPTSQIGPSRRTVWL